MSKSVGELYAFAALSNARSEHKPSHVFALFSGGHDSLTATALAFKWGKSAGVPIQAVHINTSIGIEETRQFVRDTCARQGWPLLELHPPVPYDDIVLRWGFPGPAGHGLMYRRLKERPLRQLVRDHKQHPKDRVMFVSGIRAQESVRRMRHSYNNERQGAIVWAAPIHDWSKADCNRFLEVEHLIRNPVVDILHMSGECLCGAFSKGPSERAEIKAWFPDADRRIAGLEQRAIAAGLHAHVWGARPPDVHPQQMTLSGPLCSSCEWKATPEAA